VELEREIVKVTLKLREVILHKTVNLLHLQSGSNRLPSKCRFEVQPVHKHNIKRTSTYNPQSFWWDLKPEESNLRGLNRKPQYLGGINEEKEYDADEDTDETFSTTTYMVFECNGEPESYLKTEDETEMEDAEDM